MALSKAKLFCAFANLGSTENIFCESFKLTHPLVSEELAREDFKSLVICRPIRKVVFRCTTRGLKELKI